MFFEPFIINGQNTGDGFGTADLGTGVVNGIQTQDINLAEASLAFAANGTLYAKVDGSELDTVDITTGTGTFLSSIGGDVVNIGFGSNGTLYGLDGTTDALITIDPATGNTTEVGALSIQNFGVGSGMAFVDGAFFTINDVSFASGGYLYMIDPATGASTEVGFIGGANGTNWLGLGVFNDTLYAVESIAPGGGAASAYVNVYAVNTSNASLSLVQTFAGTDAYSGGIAFGAESSTPEPSNIALAGAGLLLLGTIKILRDCTAARKSRLPL